MIKYNVDLVRDYLRGCVNITELFKEEMDTYYGDTLISAHIDLRQYGQDIVILELRIDHPDQDETKGEIRYLYRSIDPSNGVDGYSPAHVLKECVSATVHYNDLVGDRIRRVETVMMKSS